MQVTRRRASQTSEWVITLIPVTTSFDIVLNLGINPKKICYHLSHFLHIPRSHTMAKQGFLTGLFALRVPFQASGRSRLPLKYPRNPRCSCRSSISKRAASTSFWSHSFPHGGEDATFVPYVPNVPAVPPVHPQIVPSSSPVGQLMDLGAKKREKKQRYLDNLMDKAGELSLRCM